MKSARHIEGKLETMRCGRCAGLVVADHFIGGATPIGGWAYRGWRCVNCGAINFPGKAGVPPRLRGMTGGGNNRRQHRVPGTKFRRNNRIIDNRD